MPSPPDSVEDRFILAVQALGLFGSVLDHEPEGPITPPALTLMFVGASQFDGEIDSDERPHIGAYTVAWEWDVLLTLHARDLKAAQQKLKDLLPELFGVIRSDPELGGTCEKAELFDDERRRPEWADEEEAAKRTLRKTLRLRAYTLEQI